MYISHCKQHQQLELSTEPNCNRIVSLPYLLHCYYVDMFLLEFGNVIIINNVSKELAFG